MPRHWLFKSEPDAYSIDALAADGSTAWDGVRNHQARNLIRDEMEPGDLVLYYHSSTRPMGVVGLARITSAGRPDPTQFDPAAPGHDPRSTPEAPRWYLVELEFIEKFDRIVPLHEMKADPALDGMMATRRGSRLSVQPVSAAHFEHIRALARAPS